jgi:hypothetical protein
MHIKVFGLTEKMSNRQTEKTFRFQNLDENDYDKETDENKKMK